jgi:hypothetical protein
LRVFVPLLVLATAARLNWVTLGPEFEWLASGLGLSVLGAATALEVGAYFVPWLDNLLDVVAAPLAVAVGVVAMAAVTSDLPAAVRWSLAIMAGGGSAGVVQVATSLARLKSTMVSGGAANPVVAVVEFVGSLVASVTAVALPVVALVMVVAIALIVRRIGRYARGQPDVSAPTEEER